MCCGEPATAWATRTFLARDPVVAGPSAFLEVFAVRLLLARLYVDALADVRLQPVPNLLFAGEPVWLGLAGEGHNRVVAEQG